MADRLELVDARESLQYWEQRLCSLPRRARRKRREARLYAERWRLRVIQAERDAYGRGLGGTLVQLVTEGRLPEPMRQAGRRATRWGRRAVMVGAGTIALGMTLMLATAVAVFAMVLNAI